MDVRVILAAVLMVTTRVIAQTEPAVDRNTTTSEPAECLTARNVSGACVQRNSCDYSTGAIDLTLFATHGYERPCALGEVCCPQAAIVHVETSSPATSDSDEDDDFN